MEIRSATLEDTDKIVEIDRECFGEYGASKNLVIEKMKKFPGCAAIGFDNDKCIGFFIFEILEVDEKPKEFTDFILNERIKGKWLHAIMFTPRDNYKNQKTDLNLLLFAEKIARQKGCIESLVPLSKNHPFKGNGVFEFWEKNGYKKCGETRWIAGKNKYIDCWIYKKYLSDVK